MSSLLTLADRERALMREIEDLIQSDEKQEVIQNKLQEKLSLEDASDEKLAGYGKILSVLEGHIEELKRERNNIDERQKRAERTKESLERNVKWYLQEVRGVDELYAGPVHFRIHDHGGVLPLNLKGSAHEYPHETRKYKVSFEIDGQEVSEDEAEEMIETLQDLASKSGAKAEVRHRVMKSRVRDVMPEASDLVEYEERGSSLKYD